MGGNKKKGDIMDIEKMKHQYENGELPAESTLVFFSELLKSGESLSETYKAITESLIRDNYLDNQGNILKRLDGTKLNTYTVFTQVRLENTFYAIDEADAIAQAEDMERPLDYHDDSFEILKVVLNETYYQPVYDGMIWSKEDLYDHQVFHNKVTAQERFPTLKILEYHDDDIENIEYLD